ncbi:hypothetical protein [Thalassobacillus pellis]|uniref:hypothetical protein n=1 Tax=Thalassobacillus pellis TaxID=748008 RepID=UPI00196090E7|nr:hypothetical protein [Thalassobacillus pellis]MBM7553378.1 hypothetical protein [Thalassobacillus pellis]
MKSHILKKTVIGAFTIGLIADAGTLPELVAASDKQKAVNNQERLPLGISHLPEISSWSP